MFTRARLQHQAFRTGPAPVAITINQFELPYQLPAKTVRVALIDIGFPHEAISARPQNSTDEWTVVDLASGGGVAIVPPIIVPGPYDEFNWRVESLRYEPRGVWTLMWMSSENFKEHLARIVSARVFITSSGSDCEVLTGEGVKAIVCRSPDAPRDAHATIWFDGLADPIALNIFDIDSPQELARQIIARSKIAP